MRPAVRQVLLGGGGRPPSYDADAATLFAAMTTPPTTARRAQINTLILALKAAGVWSLLDVLYVLAAADTQAARLNWKSPSTFTALAVNSPTFAADRGYTSDGSSSRLRTQFTPSSNGVNYIQDSASVWVWSRTAAQSNNRDIGSFSGTNLCVLSIRNVSDAATFAVNDTSNNGVTNANGDGFFGAQRPSSSIKQFFRNGAQVGASASVASTGLPTVEQWICGQNNAGFSSRQQAAAGWGASLAGKESAFYTAMNTYMTAVGAA